jgi:hypothetical protein
MVDTTWLMSSACVDPAAPVTEPGRVPGFFICCTRLIFWTKIKAPATVAGINPESENL